MARHAFRTIVVAVLLATFTFGVLSPAVFAVDPLKSACTGVDAKKSETCKDLSPNNNPLSGTDGLLYKASLFLASIAGIVAVVMVLVSGLRYITSNGDAQKITSARKTLTGAIIGLVMIALAQTIITFVVRKI